MTWETPRLPGNVRSPRRHRFAPLLFFFTAMVVTSVCGVASEEATSAEESTAVSHEAALGYTGLVAIAVVLIHVLPARLQRELARNHRIVISFGGGMASAYVFLHLLPELDVGHAVLGEAVYVTVLCGFLLFYSGEHLLHHRRKRTTEAQADRSDFLFRFSFAWLYNWLMIYALPGSIEESGWSLVPVLVAMCLHLWHADYSLAHEHPQFFNRRGRLVLSTAPVLGWMADEFLTVHSDIADVLTGILAGWALYNILHHELPRHSDAFFRWFLSGVVVFVALIGLSVALS